MSIGSQPRDVERAMKGSIPAPPPPKGRAPTAEPPAATTAEPPAATTAEPPADPAVPPVAAPPLARPDGSNAAAVAAPPVIAPAAEPLLLYPAAAAPKRRWGVVIAAGLALSTGLAGLGLWAAHEVAQTFISRLTRPPAAAPSSPVPASGAASAPVAAADADPDDDDEFTSGDNDALPAGTPQGRTFVLPVARSTAPPSPALPANLPPEVFGLYAKRNAPNKAQRIEQWGGTRQSLTAVDDGLEWLARHQARDGHWSNDCLGDDPHSRCERGDHCDDPGGAFPWAQTGLAVLAFQAAGHTWDSGTKYSDVVRRGLDWLVGQQRADGGLMDEEVSALPPAKDRPAKRWKSLRPARASAERPPRESPELDRAAMYQHGIASFALADACAADKTTQRTPNDRFLVAADKAERFIEHMQHTDGGWRYARHKLDSPSDTSVTGWQVLALASSREAGVPVSAKCIAGVRSYFDGQTASTGRTDYLQENSGSDAMTGVGMLARQFLLGRGDSPLVAKAATYLADRAESRTLRFMNVRFEFPYYVWYNCSLAMFQAGGQAWQRWNDSVRDVVAGLQKHAGCERGSWDPLGADGAMGGRIYSTALGILTLEVYYRYASPAERSPHLTAASKPVLKWAAQPAAVKPAAKPAEKLAAAKPAEKLAAAKPADKPAAVKPAAKLPAPAAAAAKPQAAPPPAPAAPAAIPPSALPVAKPHPQPSAG